MSKMSKPVSLAPVKALSAVDAPKPAAPAPQPAPAKLEAAPVTVEAAPVAPMVKDMPATVEPAKADASKADAPKAEVIKAQAPKLDTPKAVAAQPAPPAAKPAPAPAPKAKSAKVEPKAAAKASKPAETIAKAAAPAAPSEPKVNTAKAKAPVAKAAKTRTAKAKAETAKAPVAAKAPAEKAAKLAEAAVTPAKASNVTVLRPAKPKPTVAAPTPALSGFAFGGSLFEMMAPLAKATPFSGDLMAGMTDRMLGAAKAFGEMQAVLLDHSCAELKANLEEAEACARSTTPSEIIVIQARAMRRSADALTDTLKAVSSSARKAVQPR